MDRRVMLAGLAGWCLVGCGGGGGSGAPTSGQASAGGPPVGVTGPAFQGAMVLWGDSMVPPVARALAPRYAGRDVHDGGYPGETSTMVLGHQTDDTQYRGATTLFWYGHNDLKTTDLGAAVSQIEASMAASVSLLAPGNDRYLVLSMVNDALEGQRGSPRYDAVLQVNRDFASRYGSHYVDVRAFMVAQSNPNDPQGAADLAADLPSSSLRFDEIHLTGAGADIVAGFLQGILDARGW